MSQQTWTYKLLTDCSLHREQSVFFLLYAQRHSLFSAFFFAFLLFSLSGCCGKTTPQDATVSYIATAPSEEIPAVHLPSFFVRSGTQPYNRIGSPEVVDSAGKPKVQINNNIASLYFEEVGFATEKGNYTNRIYRLHFSEVPFGLCHFNITTGNNPGLLIIYTLDQFDRTVLITTVHTCGCYLAFFPTADLEEEAFPEKWPTTKQSVYGHQLPNIVPSQTHSESPYTFTLESGTHRVAGVAKTGQNYAGAVHKKDMVIRPMEDLYQLPYRGKAVSFFESKGPRAGYVKNSSKVLERLLISWWAFDWYVGEDKAYGKNDTSTTPFYTSLKFWQRKKSDMKNFPQFLSYWGWNL